MPHVGDSYLKRHIGHMPLPRLSVAAIEGTYNYLLKSLSAGTVRRAAETLRTALADAKRQGLILDNPAEQAMLPSEQEYEPKILTAEQLQLYLADARVNATPAIHAFWMTKSDTGLRISELLGAPETAVSLEGCLPTLTVERQLRRAGLNPEYGKPKTKRGTRVLLLSRTTVEAIRAALLWKREHRLKLGEKFRDYGLLFVGPWGDR